MKNIVVCADQDRGKSYFIKNELLPQFRHRPFYINDVNLEYTQFKNRFRGVPTRENFIKAVPLTTKPKPSAVNVVWEEATGFFSRSGTTPQDVALHIFRRFHSQNLNVFVFHGLNFVPLDILQAIDFFVLFRTSDSWDKLQKKFAGNPVGDKLLAAWLDVQKKTAGTSFNREKKTYPDEHSKKWFHYKRIVAK